MDENNSNMIYVYIGIFIVLIIVFSLVLIYTSTSEYTFFQGFDSPYNDIKQITDSVGDPVSLKTACDAEPKCVGFNTDGWLKYEIKPPNQWDQRSDMTGNLGLYVKNM